jgi:hypothetical protein
MKEDLIVDSCALETDTTHTFLMRHITCKSQGVSRFHKNATKAKVGGISLIKISTGGADPDT